MAEVEQEQRETVSVEAFNRVKTERDQAKAQLDQAATALKATALMDKAYSHLKGKVPDPYGAARTISRDSLFVGVSDDELPGQLDVWLDEQRSVFGAQSAPPETEDSSPQAPMAPPPGAARPAPSPANPGGQPKLDPLHFGSPEVQSALKRGDTDTIHRLIKEGRYQPSPANPYNKT